MAGTTVTPVPPPAMASEDVLKLSSASEVNLLRLFAATKQLALHVSGAQNGGRAEFYHLCLSLGRGIDYAIATNEVPKLAETLPSLLKKVCQSTNDSQLLAAIMVLMISVKNACISGWFSAADSEALLTLANEVGSHFCSTRDFNSEPSSSLSPIRTIMSRFYPLMRMGLMLAFLEAKPGYGAYICDFQISQSTKLPPDEQVFLFVAQTDDIGTSSCLSTPPQVNFLLNGKGVEKRTNVLMETGPQLPTPVLHLLKYGTNLLQVVGEFNGNYVVAVVNMGVIPTLDHSSVLDYVQPTAAPQESDSEVIEGPSRISLSCPISFTRIKTPVKGHLCKHVQCFDFDNYVEINSRRPSWRCPHCNQHVCFTDIRIDQNLAKVLKVVAEDVSDIIISADGSWNSVSQSEDHSENLHVTVRNRMQKELGDQSNIIFSNDSAEVCDLTDAVDEMDATVTMEIEDRKPFSANCPYQSSASISVMNPQVSLESNISQNTSLPQETLEGNIHQNTSVSRPNLESNIDQNTPPFEDDFWSGIFSSILETSGTGSEFLTSFGVAGPAGNDVGLSPVMTDAVSPALNQELSPSFPQTQIPLHNDLQMQPFQVGNSAMTDEYGMLLSNSQRLNRIPVAIQALPAQNAPVFTQRTRNSSNTLVQNLPSAAHATPTVPISTNESDVVAGHSETQHPFSRSHLNDPRTSQITPIGQYTRTQVTGLQARPQTSSGNRVSLALNALHENSIRQQSLNQGSLHGANQSRSMSLPSSNLPRTSFQGNVREKNGQASGLDASQQSRTMTAVQRAMQRPPLAVKTSPTLPSPSINADNSRLFTGRHSGHVTQGTSQPVSMVDSDVPSDSNWRPIGRMRGSLSGKAYSDALNQYIFQPVQPVRPPPYQPVQTAEPSSDHPVQASRPSSDQTALAGLPQSSKPVQAARPLSNHPVRPARPPHLGVTARPPHLVQTATPPHLIQIARPSSNHTVQAPRIPYSQIDRPAGQPSNPGPFHSGANQFNPNYKL